MLVLSTLAIGPAAAWAAPADPDPGPLSTDLATLAKPSVRSAPPRQQAAILDLAPSGPGSLQRDGSQVVVDIRFASGPTPAVVDALRKAGADVIHVSHRYETVTAAVAPTSLQKVAGVTRVQSVNEDLAPIVAGVDDGPATSAAPATCFGAATSEGDLQLNAMSARNAFGVDGTGVTVGILSDSFDTNGDSATTAAEDVASGDLPGPGDPCGHGGPVDVVEDYTNNPQDADEPSSTDEGRAMAQVVHDLAPGASLAFATGFPSQPTFADNIRSLADPGGVDAKVLVDDISYLDEPFFQDGPIADAVNDVSADGVAYYTAAGNNNLVDSSGNDIASWEAPAFRNSGACPTPLPSYAVHCMDFDPSFKVDRTFGITVDPHSTLTVDLQWDQPWFGVTTDLNWYLIDPSNDVVAESEEANPNASNQRPLELHSWTNSSSSPMQMRLAIDRCDATQNCDASGDSGNPRLKVALLENGGGVSETEYPVSSGGDVVGPTIFGHNGAEDAMSVGAVPYNNSQVPEPYSSQGPVTHYFGPVTDDNPADPLPTPDTIDKPDFVATDGGADSFFGSCVSNAWRFYGTSAAAPHAAAIAALELSADPSATVSQLESAQIDTAHPVGLYPPDAVGSGMIDAFGAIDQLLGGGGVPGAESGPSQAPPKCDRIDTPTPSGAVQPTPTGDGPPVAVANHTIPDTFFALRPERLVPTSRRSVYLTFRFRASASDDVIFCRIDRGNYHRCGARLSRWFKVGRHTMRIQAHSPQGDVDPTPAAYGFRVKLVR